jgi:aminopeptidase YwaD
MKTTLLCLTLLAATIIGCSGSAPKIETPSVTAGELKEHVRYLASPELQGRKVGTPGNEKAARYIADRFKEYGLMPAGDNGSYIQKFPFVSGAKPGPGNALSVEFGGRSMAFELDKSFRTLAFSADTSVTAEMVFAGYGITDTSQKYDDYAGVDVKGKIAVVLRFTPKGDDPHSPFISYSSLRAKTFKAREMGAAGLIFVSGPLDAEKPEMVSFSFDQGFSSSGLPSSRRTASP